MVSYNFLFIKEKTLWTINSYLISPFVIFTAIIGLTFPSFLAAGMSDVLCFFICSLIEERNKISGIPLWILLFRPIKKRNHELDNSKEKNK